MALNPETNRLEMVKQQLDVGHNAVNTVPFMLVRPDGSPVPSHWATFQVGELVTIKNYTFRVAYIGETAILFEPVSPIVQASAAAPSPDAPDTLTTT